MYSSPQLFVFERKPTEFGDVVALPQAFPKMPKKVDQISPISRKSGPKSKIWPQKSRPQGVLGANFDMGL